MTFRNSFFDTALIKDKLKKSSWILTLYSIILFFAVTVANAMLIQNIKMEYANASEPEKTDRILRLVNSMISLNNEFVKIIIVIFAVVSALTAFYYINSKKQVDFYHSLPLSREKLFFISFEAGILYFVLPYIVNVFLTLLILAGSGLFGYLSIGSMTANVLINLLYYLAIYSVSVFACVLCGNAIVAILGSCALLVYFPALIFVVMEQLKHYYRTFYSSYYSVTAMVRNASPAFDFLLAAPRGVGVFRIIAYLFFTAVLIAASAALYKKRPSEAAGHAMAFKISMPIIKYPLLLLIGLGGGLFFKAASGGSCGWAIFGYISGIVLMHMVAQTIYYFDIKAVFRSLKPLAVFSALFAGLIMVAAFDLTGFDRKLPDAGDVDAVSVSFHRMYGLNKELGTINYDNLTGREKESLRRFTLRNSESIKSAVSLASLGISELDATHDRSTEEVGLVFKLRDGRELRRIYSVESDKALAYISRIYNTGEYKKKLFGAYSKKIFDATDLYIESPYFSSGDTAIASVKNPEKIKALYFSSVEELESLKAEELKDTGPNLIFRFSWSEKNESGEYTEVKNVCIPVYSNAPKTNALLSEYGIKIPDRISALQTDSIAININDPGSFYIGNNIVAERTAVSYGKENSIKITDKTEIATILPLVVPLEFERYNPFFEEDTGARVTIQSGSFMNGYSQEALFPKGKIPAFVIQMINEKLKLAS